MNSKMKTYCLLCCQPKDGIFTIRKLANSQLIYDNNPLKLLSNHSSPNGIRERYRNYKDVETKFCKIKSSMYQAIIDRPRGLKNIT